MRNQAWYQFRAIGVFGVALLVCAANPAPGQTVTGQWDFNDPADGFAATVGSDGYVWERPTDDQTAETEFGTATSFGIPPMPDGDGGVMKFPALNPFNGYAVWHGMSASGGGWYVNEYTIIYDILFPADSSSSWRSLWQTNECNTNDGDFFVNPSGGIGISGDYDGEILPDTWHRVAFSVGLDFTEPNNPITVVDKYIDTVLLDSQDLDGRDGRWSLYTADDGEPTLLLADESYDTAAGYLSSFQIRDYPMNESEIAALGPVSTAGIPGGTGVAGQWDFENPADGLAATVGNDLEFWNAFGAGCLDPNCPQDLAAVTEFGTTTDYAEVPDLPDGPAGVMRFAGPLPCNGYMFPHGAEANGGGNRVNNYTIIADLYYPYDDFYNPGDGYDPNWIPIYTTWEMNQGDAMLWIWTPTGIIGDDGQYDDTDGWGQADAWMRIVAAVDGSSDPSDFHVTKYVIYADNTVAGPVTQGTGGDETLDGKRALRTDEEVGEDVLLMFSDGFGSSAYAYTHPGFVSSIQVRDYTMAEDEVLALGGPRAAGIPGAPGCVADIDGDGDTDLSDLAALLASYNKSTGDPGYNPAADFDGSGRVDLSDLAFLLADYNCGT